jgi:hypothetical protein
MNDDGAAHPLSFLGGSTVLIGASLYFTGWTYTFYYFDSFGIPATRTDASVQQTMALAWSVLFASWGRSVTTLALLFLTLGVAPLFRARAWSTAVTSLVVLVLLSWLGFVSRSVALERAGRLRLGLNVKPITFVLTPEARARLPADFVTANDERNLFPILTTEKSVFVLNQSADTEENELPFGYVFELPRKLITAAMTPIKNIRVEQ